MLSSRQARPRAFEAPAPPPVAGRIPPHDLDAEAAVLSAILLERDALDKCSRCCKPEHFYSDANRRIYEVAVELPSQGTPIDIVSVAGMLRDRERLAQVGGSAYLAQLVDATPSVAHVERVRPHRPREVARPPAHRHLPARRGRGLRRRRRGAGVHRRRRAGRLRDRAHARSEQRPAHRAHHPQRFRADHGARAARRAHHRHLRRASSGSTPRPPASTTASSPSSRRVPAWARRRSS